MMLAQHSQLTRRLVALLILGCAGLVLLGMVVLPLLRAMTASIDALDAARFRQVQLQSLQSRPPPPKLSAPPPSLVIVANDANQALSSLQSHVAGQAAQLGLTLELAAPASSDPALGSTVELAVTLRGSEERVLALVAALEKGQPFVRFGQWRLASDGGAATSSPNVASLPAGNVAPALDNNAGASPGGAQVPLPAVAAAMPPVVSGTLLGEPLLLTATVLAAWRRP